MFFDIYASGSFDNELTYLATSKVYFCITLCDIAYELFVFNHHQRAFVGFNRVSVLNASGDIVGLEC